MTVPTISVGQPHPLVGSRPLVEGYVLSIVPGDFSIVVIYDKPTGQEVHDFINSPIQLGMVPAGDHTFFLLMQIGSGPWSDMPYTLGVLPPEERDVLDEREPDAGYLLHAELIDLTSHIVHGLRAFTITPLLSQLLDEQIAKLRANLTAYTLAKHQAEIAAMYHRCPTSNDMVQAASRIETAGMRFPR